MDLEKLKKFTTLRAVPDQLLYSLLIWPDHSIPASYGPVAIMLTVQFGDAPLLPIGMRTNFIFDFLHTECSGKGV